MFTSQHFSTEFNADSQRMPASVASPAASYGYPSGAYCRDASVSAASLSSSRFSITGEPSDHCYTSSSETSVSDSRGIHNSCKKKTTKRIRRDNRTGNVVKNKKEKQHRSVLGSVLRLMEDIIVNYAGEMDGVEQLPGNKKSSGLKYTKIDTQHAFIALTIRLLDEKRKKAIRDGTINLLQEKLLHYSRDWKTAPTASGDPTYGTFMYGTGVPCGRGENEICSTHGQLEWSLCHTTRAKENFKMNEGAFRRECELNSRRRRMV